MHAGVGDEGAGPHKTSSVKEQNCSFGLKSEKKHFLLEGGCKTEERKMSAGRDQAGS